MVELPGPTRVFNKMSYQLQVRFKFNEVPARVQVRFKFGLGFKLGQIRVKVLQPAFWPFWQS